MAVGHGQLHDGDIEPMTAPRLTFQGGKLVIKDGKAATGEECCCDSRCSCSCECEWTVTINGIAIETHNPFLNPVAVCSGAFRNKDRAEYAGTTLSFYDFVQFGAGYTIICQDGKWTIEIRWVLLTMDEVTQVPLGERLANIPAYATASLGTRVYELSVCDSNECPTGTLGDFTDNPEETVQVSVPGDADCEDSLQFLAVTADCNPLP